MTLAYVRTETTTQSWDKVYDCQRYSKMVRLTIRCDGDDIGTASTTITWSEFKRHGRLERGRLFRHDWQVTIQGCEWTIPGLRTRTEVLSEISTVLGRALTGLA